MFYTTRTGRHRIGRVSGRTYTIPRVFLLPNRRRDCPIKYLAAGHSLLFFRPMNLIFCSVSINLLLF
ncbi:hypothetical protein L1887_13123 [Cichorium endivia]|nr:hypothetical protein L1887_13123 [Cichorium endivia]